MTQFKPYIYVFVACLTTTLVWTGCTSAQKASRTGASKALVAAGFREPILSAVLNRQALDKEIIDQLLDTSQPSILFVLSGNQHLSSEQLESLTLHTSTDIRAEVAQHPNLTEDQIDRLFQDKSPNVYNNLARNPAIPKPVLTRLRQEREPDLIYFAYNPNCPDDVRLEIMNSGDKRAIQWVKTNDEARKIIEARAEKRARIAAVRK